MKAFLFLFASCCGFAAAPQSPEGTVGGKLTRLDDRIPKVELTSGAESIGGASVEDVVVLLREAVAFPICIEFRDVTREADGITAGNALNDLKVLKARRGIDALDEARLKRYEQIVSSEGPTALVGFKEKTFTLSLQN